MSHNYLLDLNQHLEARLATLSEDKRRPATRPDEYHRRLGRLDALEKFQSMLCRQFYPKLPKRLYRQLAETSCEPSPPDM